MKLPRDCDRRWVERFLGLGSGSRSGLAALSRALGGGWAGAGRIMFQCGSACVTPTTNGRAGSVSSSSSSSSRSFCGRPLAFHPRRARRASFLLRRRVRAKAEAAAMGELFRGTTTRRLLSQLVRHTQSVVPRIKNIVLIAIIAGPPAAIPACVLLPPFPRSRSPRTALRVTRYRSEHQ